MFETIEIHAQRNGTKARKSWICPSGRIGTVEELAREYYVGERGFTDCLIDSACVYGGLLWILFHDILFHDNLGSRQPLCTQFLHTPRRFYDRHRNTIELRLEEYQDDREGMFSEKLAEYCAHPFFCDPKSKIAKYHGSWLMRNQSALRNFACTSVEHGQESLIRETMVTSHKGKNKGWPDLVAWSKESLVFAEVKSTDELSDEQLLWISDHKSKIRIELVRILSK